MLQRIDQKPLFVTPPSLIPAGGRSMCDNQLIFSAKTTN
jgi:hypothetical protein